MPVVYYSIIEEHHATRRHAGLFDISHMGRLRFTGPDTVAFLDRVLTNRVDNLQPGQARYSLVLNESGCCLDDVLVYRLANHHLLVVNASNREKLLAWFGRQLDGFDVTMTDLTTQTAMIACQGPQALTIAQPLFQTRLQELRYYFAADDEFGGRPALLSRTGYTGEDGVEVIVSAEQGVALWERLLAAGESSGVRPVGLGARDTLRLEAGMPLYGHELSEQIDPIQAGLGWAVKGQTKDFVGKSALANRDPDRPIRVGLRLTDKRIAREGANIVDVRGAAAGTVTSGTFSPTLEASIAMAYVRPDLAKPGTQLAVVIREKPAAAEVVSIPFYRRTNIP